MIVLDERDVRALQEACEYAGLCDDGDGLRLDYSGRAMFGDTCVGWVGDDPTQFGLELAAVVAASGSGDKYADPYLDLDMYELREALMRMGAMRYDNMGRSMIWYWPGVHASYQAREAVGADEAAADV